MPNSRQLTLQNSIRYFFAAIFWIPVVFFSLLLVRNTLPYFSFNQQFSFIEERAVLFLKPAYKASFYIHIFAGMFCIIAALTQFSSYILKKRKAIHIWMGKIYVVVVIVLGAPTGLYMSFFAKGSFWERALFMFMALYWLYTTIKGLQSIKQKNILAHKNWMIRSYSMAMTAVTFRVYHIIFYYYGADHLFNYEISLWISVLGNMLIAEYFIFRKSKKYLNTFNHLKIIRS
ncbi:DUF2306 domain-containing protein [Ferruginibacter sp. SUN002]|uniref:DUF2306 domain-containing protein n=1 Tax=Ferruginibacter sp. SUN002 TaxID=2937789 RepID=UPI003D36F355